MLTDTGTPPSAGRIRPLNTPAPAQVDASEAGLPLMVEWVLVASIVSRWRIDDEWWRETSIARLYYDVLLEDEQHLTVFMDLLTGSWYRQRYA